MVWLRVAVEGRPELDPAVMAFQSEVFKIEQFFLCVCDKKGPQLTQDREGDTNDDRGEKRVFAHLLDLAR